MRLDEVVLRALEKKPELRYQQVSEVKTMVETIVATPPGNSRREEAQTENAGRNYRSKQTIFGLPLVHVASGIDPATSEPRVAKGVVAVGPTAIGVVACGIRAVGVISTGVFSGGVVSVGVLSVGLLTTGLICSAGLQAVGLLSLAFGGAVGLVAAGVKPIGVEQILLSENVTGLIFALMVAFNYLSSRLIWAMVRQGVPRSALSEASELSLVRRQSFRASWFLALMSVGMGINVTPFQPYGLTILAWGVLLSAAAEIVTLAAGNNRMKLKVAESLALINGLGLFSAVIPLALDCSWMRRTDTHLLVIAVSGWAISYNLKKLFELWLFQNRTPGSEPVKTNRYWKWFGVAVVLAAAMVVVKLVFFPAPPDSYFLADYRHFQRLPSGLFIFRPTHFSTPVNGLDYSCETDSPAGDHVTWNMGRNRSFAQLLCRIYGCTTNQLVLPPGAPREGFDYLYTMRDPNSLGYFEAAIKKLGYSAHWADHPVRMLVVERVAASSPSGQNAPAGGNVTSTIAPGGNATNAAPNESRLPTFAFQIRLVAEDSDQAVPTDTATNFFEGTHFETLRLRREILMDGKAVERAGWNATDDRTNFVLSLTEEGSRQFEALTAANLHRRLAMIFQGRVLFAPNIQAAIRSRTLEIPVNWDMKDLERTMNGLNQMNNPVADLRFGSEQESILPPLNGNYTFLNLRANRLLITSISDFDSRAFHEWQRANGADVGAAVEEKFPVLVAYGMATVPAIANGLENTSPADIWYNWNLMVNEPKARTTLIKPPTKGMDTYYFRTRDDTWGVLQIVGFTEHPRGVKLRYKLVQNGPPNP